jgi:hypothetical protein
MKHILILQKGSILAVILLIFISVFQFSCKKKSDIKNIINYSLFKSSFKLEERTPVKSFQHFDCNRIYKLDTNYLITQFEGSEFVFHLYDQNFTFLGSFGRKGKGPNEYLRPVYTGNYERCQNGDIIVWITDVKKSVLYKMSLAVNSNKTISSTTMKEVNLPMVLNPTNNIMVFDDGDTIIGQSNQMALGRFYLFTPKNNLLKWFIAEPKVNVAVENYKTAYWAANYADKENGHIVSAMQYFNRIDVFNKEGQILKTAINALGKIPDFSIPNKPFRPSNFRYYNKIVRYKNYYVCSSTRMSQKNYEEGHKSNKLNSGYLEVFDLDLNPICEYTLNQFVFEFAICEQGIYAIDSSSEEYPLYFYPFPQETKL